MRAIVLLAILSLGACSTVSEDQATKMMQANSAMASEHEATCTAFERTIQRSVKTGSPDEALKAQKIYRELDRSRERMRALHAGMAAAIRAIASVQTDAILDQALDIYNRARGDGDGQ